jgi:dTDP-4-dehydrorhamnose reductase
VTADILLTGAQGQLGWEIQRRGPAAGLAVQGYGRAELDITDRDRVLRSVESSTPKVVVNAAAFTAVDKSEADAAAAFSVNRDGPAHLAEACALLGVPMIHLSTDYVFDGAKSGAYVEDDQTAPLGVYGASKLAGEMAVRSHDAPHVILRTAWVYGVHGHNFVKTMLRLGRERPLVKVVDDQYGCPTFAGDLAEAVLAIAGRISRQTMPAQGYGTFHCTAQGRTTWHGFARKIFELAAPSLGRMPQVYAIATSEYPTPARRPPNSVLDCGKLTRVHGITLRPWESALREMLDATLGADAQAAKV